MLRAEELMVGDWVYCTYPSINKCLRVAEIKTVADDELKVVLFDDVRLVFPEKYIDPIPLTSEILEKNGFIKDEEDEHQKTYHLLVPTGFEKDSHTIKVTLYTKPICGVNVLFKCWGFIPPYNGGLNDIHLCSILFVHQMQHALQLCGIDKTIEL